MPSLHHADTPALPSAHDIALAGETCHKLLAHLRPDAEMHVRLVDQGYRGRDPHLTGNGGTAVTQCPGTYGEGARRDPHARTCRIIYATGGGVVKCLTPPF